MAAYAFRPWERGIDYLWQGIRDFYIHHFLWRFMAVPLAATLSANIAVGIAAHCWALPTIGQHLAKWQEESRMFRWLCQAMTYVTVHLFNIAPEKLGTLLFWLAVGYGMSLVSLAVFSLAGGFFFPAMSEMYELRVLKLPKRPRPSRSRRVRMMAGRLGYSLFLGIMLILLGVGMMILPVVGFLVAAWLGGYCYTLIFMSEAGFRRGWSIPRMNFYFSGRRDLLYGFGMTAFFLMQLPFIAVFLLPGFYLGGTLLVEREI